MLALWLFRRWENCSVVESRALKIQQKFHVLFVDPIVVGEIPVFWLICLTETSFSSSKSAMYARYSSLKARVKTMHGKWISQTFLTDHSNQVRHTIVAVYSKESLIPWRLWEATLNWGKGFSFRKGVVLEIVLLRRKVDMMGKTFSSSFVRDCIWLGKVICSLKRSQISLFFINVVHLVQVDN